MHDFFESLKCGGKIWYKKRRWMSHFIRRVEVGRNTPVPKVVCSRFTDMYSLIVAFCATALQVWSVKAGVVTLYSYTCSPNNTISISDLPTDLPSMYYFAIQSTGLNCSVTGNKAAGTAEINGCDKDLPIYFTYSTYSDMLVNQIQGGKDVEILNITCFEIPATGVAATISDTLAASILFGQEVELNVTYEVSSSLNVSSVYVGDPVEWTIYFPMNYTLQITSCSAYPGIDDSSSHSVLLITEWCSDADALITDFETNSLNTEASSVIQAFKFYNVDNVFLACDLKLCPSSSSSCIDACQSRKRRALTSRDEPDVYRTKVSKILHINGPGTSSAVQWAAAGLLTSVMSVLVCLL